MIAYMSLKKKAGKAMTAKDMVDKENKRALIESALAMLLVPVIVVGFTAMTVSVAKVAWMGM